MAKGKNPTESSGFRRNELGEVSSQDNSYGFSRAVRGYDPKEVDEYIDNLLDNYRNAQRVLDQNREEFENEKELISCEVNGLKSQKAEWEAKIAEYQAVIDDLSNKMVESAGDEAAQMIDKLQKDLKDYEKKDAENQEIIDNLSRQLGESQMIINTLNVKSNSNLKEVEELNAKIRELQTVVDNSADAEAVKAELTSENMRLSDQIGELQRVNDELQRAGADNASMVDSLSRENEENINKVAQLSEKVAMLEESVAQSDGARSELEAQYESARAEADDFMRKASESEAVITELSDKVAMLEQTAGDYERMKTESDELMRQISESEATIDNLRNQLLVVNDMVKENEELRNTINTLESQVSEFDSVVTARDTLQEQVVEFQARFDEQQKMVDQRNEALDVCLGQYAKLEETLGLLQYQIEEAKNKALGQ